MKAFLKLAPVALGLAFQVSRICPRITDIRTIFNTTPVRYSTVTRSALALGVIAVDTLMDPRPKYVKLNPIKTFFNRYVVTRKWDRIGWLSLKQAATQAMLVRNNNKRHAEGGELAYGEKEDCRERPFDLDT